MKDTFDKKFICADSSIAVKGKFKELIGVAIEFENYNDFKDLYFKELDRCNKKYGLDTNKKIIKSNDIKQRVPAYSIHEYINDLVETIIKKNKSINRIYVTNSHTLQTIRLPWEDEDITGINFIETILSQYYPIIPVWRYYFKTNGDAKTVILDGINGKITKAWKHIGQSADTIYIVPQGDETHPCLSFCDIVCTYLNFNLRTITYSEIEKLLHSTAPKEKINTEFISDALLEFIVPQAPHSIKTSTHYLHPLYLMITKESELKHIIKESEISDMIHRLAEAKGGSSFYCDLKGEDFNILKNGDSIICLDSESYNKVETIMKFSPTKQISLYDIKSFFTASKSLI